MSAITTPTMKFIKRRLTWCHLKKYSKYDTRSVKHQTMRCNVPAESPKNCYFRNLRYPFLGSVILQLDQRFSGRAEAVVRLQHDLTELSSLLPANVVNIILMLWFRKGLTNFADRVFFLQ